jgi:hypothetical protein
VGEFYFKYWKIVLIIKVPFEEDLGKREEEDLVE